jgi:hypothetical protein
MQKLFARHLSRRRLFDWCARLGLGTLVAGTFGESIASQEKLTGELAWRNI